METSNILPMVVIFAGLALVPLLVMVTTCFLKIAIVMVIVRNALGVQQVPPTMAIYGISLAISVFIMAPVLNEIKDSISNADLSFVAGADYLSEISNHLEPLRNFMLIYIDPAVSSTLGETTSLIWKDSSSQALENNIFITIPAFVISEVQAGFKIGFLIYLPFLVVDILVSNLLLAMGMQMVSPMTISMPLKILLFVVVDGWERLVESLILSYAVT